MQINTTQDLREHVALAIEVELSTIPPYLYAMYSIEDQQSHAALLIRSIVVEEMLHMALAANLLLALGGAPDFAGESAVPRYPRPLPHHKPELMLHLEPCSLAMLSDRLSVIERPENAGTPPETDGYRTLGQFYRALEIGIQDLSKDYSLFANPRVDRQLSDPSFYGPVQFDAEDSGDIMAITDAKSARTAIDIIIHQGEGLSDERWADPLHQELTHFYKLKSILQGRPPIGPVKPALTDPTTATLPPDLHPLSDLFNGLYRYVFLTVQELFSPIPEKTPIINRLYDLMSRGLPPVARALMNSPVGNGRVAGPTFEPYDLGVEPLLELRRLAAVAADRYPAITDVAGLIRGLH